MLYKKEETKEKKKLLNKNKEIAIFYVHVMALEALSWRAQRLSGYIYIYIYIYIYTHMYIYIYIYMFRDVVFEDAGFESSN